ncbi:MAG: LysR family transcriptional regulator [Burkholderiaceae bacterium]
MEFRHLRCFAALAEELHFGRAAQRLAMTQPPLSLNIQQLEASVGARLFERNSRGVSLTAAGEAFLPKALALLVQAAAAAREARDVGQGLAGQLQIGFAGTVLYRGLPQMLRDFSAANPRHCWCCTSSARQSNWPIWCTTGSTSALCTPPVCPRGFSQILVSSQPFVACLPASHVLAGGAALALAQLAGEPFAIVTRAVSPDYHDRIVAACTDAGFEPAWAFELRHWLSVVSVIAQGLGVGLVPAALQQAGLPGVVFVPLKQTLAPYDTHCLWRTERAVKIMALGARLFH